MHSEQIFVPPERLFIGDTETAGLGEFKIAVEIGLIEIDPVTLEVVREIQSLIDPQINIPPKTTEIHGISDEMVADAPTMDQFVNIVLGGGLKGDLGMICHNATFDIPLLTPLGNITHTFCTLIESRHRIKDSENHKLETLRQYFGFPESRAHRALADCHTTLHLLRKLVEISGKSVFELMNQPVRTVHVMPWGKHKGDLLPTLPRSYITWLLDIPDLETNLRTSLNKALKLK